MFSLSVLSSTYFGALFIGSQTLYNLMREAGPGEATSSTRHQASHGSLGLLQQRAGASTLVLGFLYRCLLKNPTLGGSLSLPPSAIVTDELAHPALDCQPTLRPMWPTFRPAWRDQKPSWPRHRPWHWPR